MKEVLEAAKSLVDTLTGLGLSIPVIVLIAILLLIVAEPERAQKLKTLVVTPFFYLWRLFARAFISGKISVPVTKFINNDLLAYLDGVEEKRVKVKLNFIRDSEELKRKGNKIIVRLREDDDQTKNILRTASIIIPTVVCPFVRTNIDKELSKAIDLTVLRKLAGKLGKRGDFIYKLHFLDPELLSDPSINSHIQQLLRVDRKGLFISIFSNELHYLGEEMFANADRSNRTADVLSFLEFLIKIAERDERTFQELTFHSKSINLAIVLLAISEKAATHGVDPYIKRVRKEFYEGSESVYLIAYKKAWSFLTRLLKTVRHDDRYRIAKTYDLLQLDKQPTTIRISLIRTEPAYSDKSFSSHIKELGILNGSIVEGKVMDVSFDRATVGFSGLTAFVKKSECSWYTTISCTNEFDVDQKYSFKIKSINFANGSIELTRRFDDDDPWIHAHVPAVGDIVEIVPQVPLDLHIVCRTEDGLEVKVPNSEVVWGELSEADVINVIGQRLQAKILLVQEEGRLIRASLRQVLPNPWEEIHRRFPVGSKMLGTVRTINPEFVTVEISDGVVGRVPKESFRTAGHEYKDFVTNLVTGQKLEVEVKRVWIGKQKISLELSRNLDGRAVSSNGDTDNQKEHVIVKMKNKKPSPKV
jgi:hypothetical protein